VNLRSDLILSRIIADRTRNPSGIAFKFDVPFHLFVSWEGNSNTFKFLLTALQKITASISNPCPYASFGNMNPEETFDSNSFRSNLLTVDALIAK
jgi:hypothetical protein